MSALKVILFLALVSPPLFLELHTPAIHLWDEARYAINAYEMHKNGNYFVPYYEGKPDSWNIKPPLMAWLQVICIKLFGFNEFAVRLPSALAGLLTTVLLMCFSIRYIQSYWFGLIASLILITAFGYVDIHAARTGDYDALFTLFTTLYLLSFFLFMEKGEGKYLHFFFAGVALAVFTKNVQGLLFIPAIGIYFLARKNVSELIKSKWFWIDLLLCLGLMLGYYALRERHNPGYIYAIAGVTNYFTPRADHQRDFIFYFIRLIDYSYATWYWLVPCGIAIALCIKNDGFRQIALFSALAILVYWLIISFSTTKLEWYQMPLFPMLALLTAIPVFWLFGYLKELKEVKEQFRFNIVPFVLLFMIFLHPYERIIKKVSQEISLEKKFYNISYFLKWAAGGQLSLKDHYLCYDGYNAHLLFYIDMLNNKGQNVGIKDWHRLLPGDMIISSQPSVQEHIEENYQYGIIRSYLNVKTYSIYGNRGETNLY